jgi:hypothetical protein
MQESMETDINMWERMNVWKERKSLEQLWVANATGQSIRFCISLYLSAIIQVSFL